MYLIPIVTTALCVIQLRSNKRLTMPKTVSGMASETLTRVRGLLGGKQVPR